MKILVFSDSHGVTRYMQKAIDREKPERVLHLGDIMSDARELMQANPGLPVERVCGNCDGSGAEPEELELTVGGHKIFMIHGHTYRVKMWRGLAVRAAKEKGAQVLLFGHTHQPLVDRDGPLWIMNPGTIRGIGKITYGVLTVEGEDLDCRIAEMEPEK